MFYYRRRLKNIWKEIIWTSGILSTIYIVFVFRYISSVILCVTKHPRDDQQCWCEGGGGSKEVSDHCFIGHIWWGTKRPARGQCDKHRRPSWRGTRPVIWNKGEIFSPDQNSAISQSHAPGCRLLDLHSYNVHQRNKQQARLKVSWFRYLNMETYFNSDMLHKVWQTVKQSMDLRREELRAAVVVSCQIRWWL